jgi:hypothetical protein
MLRQDGDDTRKAGARHLHKTATQELRKRDAGHDRAAALVTET